jgi:UDP-glucose 4-epimerase
MKIIVTGGEGFIGSHIVDRLVKDGHDVLSIDDRSAPQNDQFYKNPGAKYKLADIRDVDWSV